MEGHCGRAAPDACLSPALAVGHTAADYTSVKVRHTPSEFYEPSKFASNSVETSYWRIWCSNRSKQGLPSDNIRCISLLANVLAKAGPTNFSPSVLCMCVLGTAQRAASCVLRLYSHNPRIRCSREFLPQREACHQIGSFVLQETRLRKFRDGPNNIPKNGRQPSPMIVRHLQSSSRAFLRYQRSRSRSEAVCREMAGALPVPKK